MNQLTPEHTPLGQIASRGGLRAAGRGRRLSPRDEQVRPWDTEKHPDWEASKMATYAAMVDRMDQSIGRLVVALNPVMFRGGSVDDLLGVRVKGGDDTDQTTGEGLVELEEEWGLEIEEWEKASLPADGWETEREGSGAVGPRWLGR